MISIRWRAALPLPCILLVGCGGSDYSSVTGIVTYEGKPVADASVTFTPLGEGKQSYGTTDASGRYQLATRNGEQEGGARNGLNGVSISKVEIKSADRAADPKIGSLSMVGAPPLKIRSLLPEKYANASTSGLTFEVQPGENDANFDLAP